MGSAFTPGGASSGVIPRAMADIFGRHAALQACIIAMLAGSAICTAVPASPSTYGAFLLGRALQGLACAGLGVVIRVVLADKVSLRDNAKNVTIFTLTGGIMYGVGPDVLDNVCDHNSLWSAIHPSQTV